MTQYLAEFWILSGAFMLGAISPGPDALIVVRNSTRVGRRSGIMTAMGIGTSITLHCLYILLGLGVVFETFPWFATVIQYAGGAYLCYLGVRALITKRKSGDGFLIQADEQPMSTLQAFRMGFLTNFLNPFAILHLISFLSVLVADATPQSVRIIYALVLGSSYLGWNLFLSLVLTQPYLQKKFFRISFWIEKAAGVLLIYLALSFVFG